MSRRIRRIFLAVAMTALSSTASPPLLASGDEYCDCGYVNPATQYGYIYMYEYAYGQYWYFVDQWPYHDSTPIFGGSASDCVSLCSLDATNYARSLCDIYGNANRHIQIDFAWYFYDPDTSQGGSEGGWINTGTNIIMCGSF